MQMPWQETSGLQHISERVQMAGLKLYATPPQGAVSPWAEAHVTPAASAAAMISDDVSTPLVVVRSHTSPAPAHVAVQLSPCAPLNQPGGGDGWQACDGGECCASKRHAPAAPGGIEPGWHCAHPLPGVVHRPEVSRHAASVVAEDHSHTQSSTMSIMSSTPKHDVAPLAAHLHVSAAEQDGRSDEGGADGGADCGAPQMHALPSGASSAAVGYTPSWYV